VTIGTAASAPTGTSTLTVTGTGGSLTHTASVTLAVTSATTGPAIVNRDGEREREAFGGYGAQPGPTGPTNGDRSIAQTFVAPSGGGTLSFWYQVHCPDTVTGAARVPRRALGAVPGVDRRRLTRPGLNPDIFVRAPPGDGCPALRVHTEFGGVPCAPPPFSWVKVSEP